MGDGLAFIGCLDTRDHPNTENSDWQPKWSGAIVIPLRKLPRLGDMLS